MRADRNIKKGAYFRLPNESSVKTPGQLEDPEILRLMHHVATAHGYEGEFSVDAYEVVDT